MSTDMSTYLSIDKIAYPKIGENDYVDLRIKLNELEQILEFIKNLPVMPSYANKIFKEEKIKAIRGTTGIEGNVLNEEEIGQLLGDKGIHSLVEKEVLNSERVHNFIIEWSLKNPEEPITETLIKQIHKYNTEELNYPNNQPGKYRAFEVIYGYPPKKTPLKAELEIENEMKKLVNWINDEKSIFPLLGLLQTLPPLHDLIKGILAHYAITRIHPFPDGNGRTARALEALIFFHKAKINDYCFYGIANYCYRNRNTYIEELSKIDTSGNATSFLMFCLNGFYDSISGVKDRITDVLSELLFMDYVHELRRQGRLKNAEAEILKSLIEFKTISYSDYFEKHFPNRSEKTKGRYLKKILELKLIDILEKDGKKDAIVPNLKILKGLRRLV